LPSNEAILEALTSPDRPWAYIYHISYFLLELRRIEAGEIVSTVNGHSSCPINPIAMHIVYIEGNMESITTTIPIDISKTPGIVEKFFIRVDFSPKRF